MVEIRLVGFSMQDMDELVEVVCEAVDSFGLKSDCFITFDNSRTRLCLTGKSFPHAIVCSDNQGQTDLVAYQINTTLGIAVKKEHCQDFVLPVPTEDWINRGR